VAERKIFEKVVSGGQTGADQGALDAALELGHPCGGWCPKGRKSEDVPIPDRYPLLEHSSGQYQDRTEANVRDSDGTLIFTYGRPTGGTRLTLELARKLDKPYLVFDLDFDPVNVDPEKVWNWGWEHEVFILNVAGPRESKQPGTQILVKAIVGRILEFARMCYSIRVQE
jgi:hypothetical protein